mmetsp:Transcript_18181/g.36589  ORF Transcript_18181/g.36589 Transcript_18181/m.36589 type:complete len:450 (+) Transcript_18181:177-1526(+)
MISVDTKNTEYNSPMERLEGGSDRIEMGSEYLVPIKGEGDSSHKAMSVEGPSDKNKDVASKPTGLPPVIETSSTEHMDSIETNSRGGLLSPSFDDGWSDEKADSFPVDYNDFSPTFVGMPVSTVSISETNVSTPSVKDMIRLFGSPKRANKNAEEQQTTRRLSFGSSHSGVSRHTDAPLSSPRFGHEDDSSSQGDYSIYSMNPNLEPHSSPGKSKTMSELDVLREQSIVSSRRRLQTRSAARRDRLHYKLNDGRKGMSQKDISRSRTFLPADKLIEMKQEQKPTQKPERELYVWLMSPTNKVFEVVRVPYRSDTNIGDVLVLARSAALDPVLAEQRYVSLCNEKLELVAPPLPVNFLFDRTKTMQSLMAVPDGSTAHHIRNIQKALTGNRRVRKWLQQKDIFCPLSEEEKLRMRQERREKKERSKKKRRQAATEQLKLAAQEKAGMGEV